MNCCKERKEFIKSADKIGYVLGQGVDGCGAGFNQSEIGDADYVELSDGFDSAHLYLNYCPFCGKRLVK